MSQRGLPAGSEAREYHQYVVLKPIKADVGEAAGVPLFDATGGGVQYSFYRSIQQLVDDKFLGVIE